MSLHKLAFKLSAQEKILNKIFMNIKELLHKVHAKSLHINKKNITVSNGHLVFQPTLVLQSYNRRTATTTKFLLKRLNFQMENNQMVIVSKLKRS